MGTDPGLWSSHSKTDAGCGTRVPSSCMTSSNWRGRRIAEKARAAHHTTHDAAPAVTTSRLQGLLKSFFTQHVVAVESDCEVTVFRLAREPVALSAVTSTLFHFPRRTF